MSCRVIDELVKPLRDINIDDTEFACLKAIVFFDPSKISRFKLPLQGTNYLIGAMKILPGY